MGGINPVQLGGYGSPSSLGGGLLGFLAQGLQGYEAGHKERVEEQQQKAETAQKQAQLKIEQQNADLAQKKAPFELQQLQGTVSAQQQASAQARLEALKPVLFSDGGKQSDPQYVDSIKQTYKELGVPPPIKIGKDGKESIDVSSWKKPFASLDQKQQTAILGMSPEQRKPILDQLVRAGYDIDKSSYTTSAVVDAKEQRLRAGLQEKIRHDKTAEASFSKRTAIQGQLAAAREADDYATVGLITAKIGVANQEALAIPARVQQAQQRIVQESQKLQLAVSRFQASPHTQQTQMITAANDALRSYNAVNSDLTRLNVAQSAAIAAGADADTLSGIADQITDLKGQLGGFKELHDKAMGALKSGVAGASAVGAASGNLTSIIPKKVTTNSTSGAKYTLNGKKAFNATDGQVYIEQSPNNWTPIGSY